MTIRTIFQLGNPALYETSVAVQDPCSPAIKALIGDMRDTLEQVKGIGLAAPQIGVLLRVVLYCLPPDRIPPGSAIASIPWTPMINPVIEPLSNATSPQWERCLSLPGLYAKVPRFDEVRIRYLTPEGNEVVQEWKGYVAKLLQHECDHLDGVLYPMRMADMKDLAFTRELCGSAQVYSYSNEEFDGL